MNIDKCEGPTLRSRQHKTWSPKSRPVKRLFTPEIKRHLKSWLVKRRENPYPNREEKTKLADQTGLTYIQICNWFANWRRKLKNSGKRTDEYTWSNLIKGYNDQALGNVEHLSISSNDSIWEEREIDRPYYVETKTLQPTDHCYSSSLLQTSSKSTTSEKLNIFSSNLNHDSSSPSSKSDSLPQCFQISSTTDFITKTVRNPNKKKKKVNFSRRNYVTPDKHLNKYESKLKNTFRDKNWNYKRMMYAIEDENGKRNATEAELNCETNLVLKKWRKSAALYRPNGKIYLNSGSLNGKMKKFRKKIVDYRHGREELDAAEALTFLSRASINK